MEEYLCQRRACGYIIREEKIFQGENYKNGILQIKTEGQRVAKGDPIFRYYTNNEENLIKKISDLDLQIQDALEQSTSIYSSDLTSIDKQIEERLNRIILTNKISQIEEYKKEINDALTKKAKLIGELSPSGSYIKKLIKQRSEYEEKLNSGSEYIRATISGLVSYRIDGLEEKLNVDSINEEFLENLNLKTGEMIHTSNETGKIVNNYYSYIMVVSKSKESKEAKVGDNVQLLLSTGDEVKAKIQNITDEKSGNRLITFKVTDCIEKLINYRKISVEIVWWNANGLKVPNSSILEKEGKTYIVRKRVGYTDEIIIKILKKSEDYCIIDNYTSLELKEIGYTTEQIKNTKNISLYDEILLKPTK